MNSTAAFCPIWLCVLVQFTTLSFILQQLVEEEVSVCLFPHSVDVFE
jgi:hypothetical protein